VSDVKEMLQAEGLVKVYDGKRVVDQVDIGQKTGNCGSLGPKWSR
jgi:ABC-type lipopolysaccharide export system ATPase subunit